MTTAMKIIGHKSERMHRRYSTIMPEDLQQAAAKLHAFRANTLITPERLAAGVKMLVLEKTQRAGVAQW